MQEAPLSIVAVIGKNRELGSEGKLLWRLPDDMRRFKALTMGHPVIMGRKTWESLPEKFRPLPGRTNIVVTRQAGYGAEGATIVNSLEAASTAARHAEGANEIFVIGGGMLYATALPFASRLYLTLVDANAPQADTFFPSYEEKFRTLSGEDGDGEPSHRFLTLERE